MKKLAMIFCAILALMGCANKGPISGGPRPEPKAMARTSVKTFPTYGMSKEELRIFEYAIGKLEPEIQKCVRTAIVLGVEEYIEHENRVMRTLGHTHPRSGEICLKRDEDDYYVIMCWWHEAAHTWRQRLPARADEEWKKIAGDVYADTYDYDPTTRWEYPKNGILRLHGSANPDEDMATYVEAIYARIYLGIDDFRGVDWNDQRYIRKIQFLYRWGGISKEAYEATIAIRGQAN